MDTLGTSRDFTSLISWRGLAVAPFDFSPRERLEDPDARAAFESKRAAIRLYRKVGPMTAPYHRMMNRWRREVLGLPPRPFWAECEQR